MGSDYLIVVGQYMLACNGSVACWILSHTRNATKGGDPRSRHLVGRAVDVVFDVTEDQEKFLSLITQLPVKAVTHGEYVHVQW